MLRRLIFLALIVGLVQLGAQTNPPKTFGTPKAALDALLQTATQGLDALKVFFGADADTILRTGDPVDDKNILDRFNQRAAEAAVLQKDEMNLHRINLLVGNEQWPFAIPLIEKDGRWFFDVREGKAEIRRRTIGGNELDVIEICQGYVEAQELYAENDWNGNSVREYARKIISTPGKKDGLYWPGDDSPVAEAFAKAIAAGYPAPNGTPRPFHGYFFKVLLAQGPDAEDGEQDYVVHGLMIGGFALVAWPAEYGVSGIMTFIVNQDGVVYEKDLGPQTAALAKAMAKFDPDRTWRISAQQYVEE